uniref:K Homology domain-containing protein n=2 Tax=Araucaria cunninghamii TaxID=56994 RepID=A0A0D6QYY3_ARACU
MEGAYSKMRPKRPYLQAEDNGHASKRFESNSSAGAEGGAETVFRVLCPEAKAGSVIGKGGSIIQHIRRDTGARITVQETVTGCEERVILISAPDNQGRDGDYDFNGRFGNAGLSENPSPAQEALFRVHDRICEDVDKRDSNAVVTTRLILPNSQVGCLMGKGGKIIQQMRDESKAQIRVLPKEQNPPCAESTDEILQVVGNLNVVKKALWLISMRLRGNSKKERVQPTPRSSVYPPDYNAAPPDVFFSYQDSVHHYRNLDGPVSGMRSSVDFSRGAGSALGPPSFGYMLSEGDGSYANEQGPSSSGEEIVFRVLCPNKKIGGVIGKGGSIIKSLRDEIGVKIKVTDVVPGSDDRIIIISSHEVPEEDLSPAQEALLHIQTQIVDLGPDKDGVITTRLLVPANQVGCLIGKGGSIISEMRRATGANIRILPRKDLPPCALETDELVQIVGDISVSREALVKITSRLRANLYPEKPLSGTGLSSSFGSLAPLSGRGGFEPLSPGRSYSSNMVLQGGLSSSSYLNLPRSPDLRSSKPKHDIGSIGNLSDFEEPVIRKGGSSIFGRSSAGLITKTTVEVLVPEHILAALLGNSGHGIAQMQKITGAKVKLLDVRPGSSEGVIEISGTPEETHAAKCLIEAAIINRKTFF